MSRDALLQSFRRLVHREPDAEVVVSGKRRLTIGELDALASEVASVARRLGLGPGCSTALIARNGPGFLALLVGLRRAGTAVLLLDAGTTGHEINRVVSSCGLAAVARCARAWPGGVDDFALALVSAGAPVAGLDDRVAVVKLTSGSSGEPRGIATRSESLLADDEALTRTMEIRPADRLLATVPFSHSYGLSSLVIPALVRGTVLVLPEGQGPFAPLEAARTIGATVFHTVPAYLAGLLRVGISRNDLEPLRLVVSAGARLSPETATRFRETFGLAVHTFYGASECGGIAYDREGTAAERGTVGEPVDGVSVELQPVDGVDSADAARVVVRSPAVAAGYVPVADNRLGEGRFVADDLARRHGNEITLVGRLNELINVRGRKVNPSEIEKVIGEQESVEEVRVIGVSRGDSTDELVRAVVACRPGSLTEEQLVRWCRGRLSEFKIPRSVLLVDRIPRNERGKIDHDALARLADAALRPHPAHG